MEDKQLPTQVSESAMSTLILKGDISKLSDADKVQYYHSICNRLGLDPITKPFDYLVLQGKQTLYLNKGGAEQLNKIHGVSTSITDKQKLDDIYVVTARAEICGVPRDRYNESTGAVNIKGLNGDGLCNAMMKAETKAKRRATIGLLGLAMLDETEVETIPNATKHEATVEIAGEQFSKLSPTAAQSLPGDMEIEPDPTPEEWQNLKQRGLANGWAEAHMKLWIDNAKKFGKSNVDIYQDALDKFGKKNDLKEEVKA